YHFYAFLIQNFNKPSSSVCFNMLCPPDFVQAVRSPFAPLSVAWTSSTSPDSISSIAFFVLTIGIGHAIPVASNILSASMVISSLLTFNLLLLNELFFKNIIFKTTWLPEVVACHFTYTRASDHYFHL